MRFALPLLLVTAVGIAPSESHAQRGGRGGAAGGQRAGAPVSLSAVADQIFAQYNSTHTPGCAVGVSQQGRVLMLRGYGMADLESGVPITPATVLESGSVAKQFAATAIILLAQDGRLSLDDPVRKYIPELPEYPRPILIHHLLSHTSGLREWSNLVALSGWPRGTRAYTLTDLYDFAFRQQSLNYPVGDHYSYTNTGYALLPLIVQRVSGVSFAEFSHTRIFTPLGLANTRWRDDFRTVVPGRAQAYARSGAQCVLSMPFDHVHGPGGLLTTIGDWLRWNAHLTNSTLGADVSASLATRGVLTNGKTITYARGLMVQQYRGTEEISHSGSTAGYTTYLARYPAHGLSIAVMCNAAGAPAGPATRQLADALIPGLAPPPPGAAADTVATDPTAAAALAGIYYSPRTRAPLLVGSGDGFSGQAPRALRDGSWLIGNRRATVERAADGSVRALRIPDADGDTVVHPLAARARWQPAAQELAQFAGSYRSDEIGATWTVRVEGTRLVASARAGVIVNLTPLYRDGFESAGGLGNVWFTRDARGAVREMHVGADRAWDVVFRK